MDRTKFEQLITENMKAIFGFSLTRLNSVSAAEELTSDILYELVKSAQNLKDEERFYGFMWKIAENTYIDYLRKKSKPGGKWEELDPNLPDKSDSVLDEIIKREDLNLLRRELSLLSKQYRDATVLYYIENYSCSEVAEKLAISTEMVKYSLFRARKIIREGMNMERLFGEKSYRPSRFEIDFWGTKAGEDREYQDFRKRKIKGNILLCAYYTPVTIQEISVELGVSLPYLEDEIRMLMERQYLVCKNEKYLTNIPIFTRDCTERIDGEMKKVTEETAAKFSAISDEFAKVHGDKFANENLLRWQKLLLCLHFSLSNTNEGADDDLPEDGPYSLVNGGGGRGVIWGRSRKKDELGDEPEGIQGVYNLCPAQDGRGSVIAMNFSQVLNGQKFLRDMIDPIVCTAVDCFAYLPGEWRRRLDESGYAIDGKPNFPVYTREEYNELSGILKEGIAAVSELNSRTAETAARITADLAPAHIRKNAEYVGSIIYRFKAIENLVNALYDMRWVDAVDDSEKPAVCVVKS